MWLLLGLIDVESGACTCYKCAGTGEAKNYDYTDWEQIFDYPDWKLFFKNKCDWCNTALGDLREE